MKLIELHILQSFPVSCLNRDDVGSPKTAIFGGATRGRISSQCLKRAIREFAQDRTNKMQDTRFGGIRTKLLVDMFKQGLVANGIPEADAVKHAEHIADILATIDTKNRMAVNTLTFLAPSEIAAISKVVADYLKAPPAEETAPAKKSKKGVEKNGYDNLIGKACKEVGLMDAADIALFGRMAASLPSLTVEGAAMFSHALSTHQADNDLDFYSAVDERKPKTEDAGAGMIGTLEFNSAVYYRYIAINLDLLADSDHLSRLTIEERRAVVSGFLRAAMLAVPGARKNSMNASTLPSYVMGIVKSGQPLQLVNAFEVPVSERRGIVAASVDKLKKHYAEQKQIWGLTSLTEVAIPETDFNSFCQQILVHVP